MAIIIATELQSDLETLYKIAGDLLNEIEKKEIENCPQLQSQERCSRSAESAEQMLELVKFRLADIAGTLQKDIVNLRHIVMKLQAGEPGA